ncbi:hypothetical protein [Streptomyces sp. NPDC048659]|uniref:hypothetical protein n=1 Tax=Streptomyces sp. NPDC048659 TaxID=3155489 RepID=UPI003442F5A8
MPATLTLTSHRPGPGEVFDAETLALLDELDVPLTMDIDADLDIAFGTPLELYHQHPTASELAALATRPVGEVGRELVARVHAAEDILAGDPSITARVRERLVDVLLPYAVQLRIKRPAAAAPVPRAA